MALSPLQYVLCGSIPGCFPWLTPKGYFIKLHSQTELWQSLVWKEVENSKSWCLFFRQIYPFLKLDLCRHRDDLQAWFLSNNNIFVVFLVCGHIYYCCKDKDQKPSREVLICVLVYICSYQFLDAISQNLELFYPLPISAVFLFVFFFQGSKGHGIYWRL